MGKKILSIGIIISVIGICAIVLSRNVLNNNQQPSKISLEEAEELLLEHLTDRNRWSSDYVIEPVDSNVSEFRNVKGYFLLVLFSDNVEQMAGRLLLEYMVAEDGRIFWYDPGNDELVQEK